MKTGKVYLHDILKEHKHIFVFEPYHDPVFDKILDEEKKRNKLDCNVEIYAPQPIEHYNAQEISAFIDFFDKKYRINLEFPPETYIDQTDDFKYVISKCVHRIKRHKLRKEHTPKSLLSVIADWLMESVFSGGYNPKQNI
jgi:hypothetical protein